MEDNRDFERAARSKIGRAGMEPPPGAWQALDADLDRRQAAMLHRKAGRLKRMAVVLVLLLVGFVSFHFLTVPDQGEGVAYRDAATPDRSPAAMAPADEGATNTMPPSESGPLSQKTTTTAPVGSQERIQPAVRQAAHGAGAFPSPPVSAGPEYEAPGESTLAESPVASVDVPLPGNGEEAPALTTLEEPAAPSLADMEPTSVVLSTADSDSARQADPAQGHSRFSLALYVAPEYAWNGISDNSDNQFDDAAMYKNREHTAFSYSAGVSLAYALDDTWSFVTGVRYSTFTKTMSVPTMYAEGGDDGMHLLFSTSNGVVSMPFDDSHPGVQAGDSVAMGASCRQRLTFIHIPLMVQWRTGNKPFSFYVNAGATVNFVARQKASVSMDGSEMSTGSRFKGLEAMNYGLQAGAGLQVRVTDGLGLFAEPVFRMSLSSITRNMAVNSYPHSVGLNAGLLLRF